MTPDLNDVELIAREVALEIMELNTAAEVASFRWPDDVNGDTADRARGRAERIIKALAAASRKAQP